MGDDDVSETLGQLQSRHRKELKDLQGRITSKKKNASKKTRKGVNDECTEMERALREKQAQELAALGSQDGEPDYQDANNHRNHDEEENHEEGQEGTGKRGEEGLERAAENLHISAPNDESGPSQSLKQEHEHEHQQKQQQQQQQQQPDKKRNRQKERLARRAAEQEAAAEAAASEASTMTNHRAKESDYMNKMFATYGLVEKDIEPDGHCLFSAVADQLQQNAVPLSSGAGGDGDGDGRPASYKLVREAAADYMGAHRDDFAPFLEEDLDSYTTRMRDTAEWGGQLELTALAKTYGVEIRVVQNGRTEQIGEEEGMESGKVLWLAYYRHGYGLGEHYNSLRKK